MRKVLVSGAAFAATCIAAVAVPAGAQADPTPTPSPPAATPAVPSPVPSGTPGTTPPSAPGTPDDSAEPSVPGTAPAPGTEAPAAGGRTDAVVSTRAVMVTPKPPKTRTYAYGRSGHQRIDAYWEPLRRPAAGAAARTAPLRPAVLVLHGGYWLEGDKSGWKYFARRLSTQGFAVFSANYRLAPAARWPAQRDDVTSALAFIKKHAKHWNVDPNRIVIVGSSAGGMLATQLGTAGTAGGGVRGVVALSPVNTPYLAYQDGAKADATAGQRKLRRAVVSLVGCEPSEADAECWTKVDDANSTSHVTPDDAPMLLMHAEGDMVPATQSTGLASALRAAGVPATVRVLPGTRHGGSLLDDETAYPEILNWINARVR
ncbi:alpha/beta hydrolase [Spirillospora albida]|uniref:alpha/beta hydrolase n=1 Tax=Spirillospora albida TaxID=58123 RepID=UPI000AD7D95A|nr:alpha/beta hydrolase [Spirillospora albida]